MMKTFTGRMLSAGALAAACLLVVAVPGVAGSGGSSAPVAVSSTSVDPFASCTADYPQYQPGTLYSNSEVEPFVAVNPTNPANIVAVWQQDRWSNAGSRGNLVAASFDGGVTWTTVTETKTSYCTGGTDANGGGMFRSSNPWLSFSPGGTAYLLSGGIPFFGQSAVGVSRSSDGGLTWSDPMLLEFETDNAKNDKPTITADPNDADAAYAVWTRNEFPREPAAPTAEGHSGASRGPAWFSRTLDGGTSWEPAREIYDPGEQNGTLGHQIVVLPDGDRFSGELVDIFEFEYVYNNSSGLRGVHVAAIRSSDKGAAWSNKTLIADAFPVAVLDPVTGARIRTGANIPDVAVDPGSGALYAVWLDARFSGGLHDDIALSMSTDGGRTWTSATRANRTPVVADPRNRNAFTPSVEVAANGTVGVSYYDLRYNGSDSDASKPLETDRFLALCESPSASAPDRCASGWTERRLTPSSFDLRAAPNSEGLFLGGYEGLASAGDEFLSVFAQSNSLTDPATVYFTAVP
jgi:hypothetical protein